MTLFTIVGRELVVAARKRSTFWLRVCAATLGLVIGGGFMLIGWASRLPSPQMGRGLFAVLTWIGVFAALLLGLFFTSDCLSEEKREGTLGLLFLTDLKGYDVVSGKLLATSLRGFFALIAVLPVLAVPWLMGGVSGGQFWKVSLALLNALFMSLSVGIFISSISRDAQKALGATFLAVLVLTLGLPLLDAYLLWLKHVPYRPITTMASPGYVFITASDWGKTNFWKALAINQAICWVLLICTTIILPRSWQERASSPASAQRTWAYRFKYGGLQRRKKIRRKYLDIDPMIWLGCRERWQSATIWLLAGAACFGFVYTLANKIPVSYWTAWTYLGSLYTFILYFWAASQSSRLFVEAKRNGMIELLLAGPLSERAIVMGQWRAFLRMFAVPVLLLICVHVGGVFLSQSGWTKMTSSIGGTKSSMIFVLKTITLVLSSLMAIANLVAIAWFGMWMGLTTRSANFATLKTIVFVQIIPMFLSYFISAIGTSILIFRPLVVSGSSSGPGTAMMYYPYIIGVTSSLIMLGKDVGFFVWARSRLFYTFRLRASQSSGRPVFISAPSVPPPLPAPPIIAPTS
jgi:ABC-type transport system involved in cytochrome c biogenesis permease component